MTTSTKKKELTTKRSLKMHKKLLFDTIKRQAGTLEKANTEAIMNSIEAGAKTVSTILKREIVVDDDDKAIMTIIDDGEGILTREDLIAHFETFGTPHEEHENTRWKQFRMGRGQLFAFGKNTWRTATFKMEVDINNWGLEYHLTENLPYIDGCEILIELYTNPINGWPYASMESYKEAIKKQVRFVETPCYFNDEQINTPGSECKWDFEDEYAKYLFNVGKDMTIYNLGIYVQDVSVFNVGMGGIVVSKKQLEVNFARNDVLSSCPVYIHINEIIRKNKIKKTRKRRRLLTKFEIHSTLRDLRDGVQEYKDIKNLGLIFTAQGKKITLEKIRKNRQPWSFTSRGDRTADRIIERELGLCIDETILTDLNYTGHRAEFFSWLVRKDGYYCHKSDSWDLVEKLYSTFDELKGDISEKYFILPDKKITATERRILKVLQEFNCWDNRVIILGTSDIANAWTDGYSRIVIDRSFLKSLCLTMGYGVNKLMITLAHEMAHDEKTDCTHYHGPEFYENMVRILESNKSPTILNQYFSNKMKTYKLSERRMKEMNKRLKDKKKEEKKLGLVTS